MTHYTVIWDTELQTDLTNLWVESDSEQRAFLTKATGELDLLLKQRPENTGRSVPDTPYRVLLVTDGPRVLEGVFHVLPDDRLVRVINIRLKHLTP